MEGDEMTNDGKRKSLKDEMIPLIDKVSEVHARHVSDAIIERVFKPRLDEICRAASIAQHSLECCSNPQQLLSFKQGIEMAHSSLMEVTHLCTIDEPEPEPICHNAKRILTTNDKIKLEIADYIAMELIPVDSPIIGLLDRILELCDQGKVDNKPDCHSCTHEFICPARSKCWGYEEAIPEPTPADIDKGLADLHETLTNAINRLNALKERKP
jgi:hypothetical protein